MGSHKLINTTSAGKPADMDEYIAGLHDGARMAMEEIRATVKRVVPDAEETICYAMPAFKLFDKSFIYFAAFKNHIGLYSVPARVDAFKELLAGYKTGRGSVQFPLDKPMPLELVTKIVKFRMKQLTEKQGK